MSPGKVCCQLSPLKWSVTLTSIRHTISAVGASDMNGCLWRILLGAADLESANMNRAGALSTAERGMHSHKQGVHACVSAHSIHATFWLQAAEPGKHRCTAMPSTTLAPCDDPDRRNIVPSHILYPYYPTAPSWSLTAIGCLCSTR